MKLLHIGDEWVEVPLGYVHVEAEYTKEEDDLFISLVGDPQQEVARDKVLQKRVEFYKKFKAGEIDIPEPQRDIGWFERYMELLNKILKRVYVYHERWYNDCQL